ncbi:uncharacterized protein LOC121376701 [Gigantopelta aegis]|uniref:uncharacterized protein LOC121376701 n=1 Tax=Gigantopelta aegis TaxID=1735272 RepID=UPI001B88AC83|nr:uncharacterized protein LOC121376701 [Gigantopelta aegis]
MILAWFVGCVFLSDVSLGNVLFRRDDFELQVNLTTVGETQEHDGSGHPFCDSHPRCEAKMRTFMKSFSEPDFTALANSDFLDTFCADDYLGDACTGTDVCKDVFATRHPNPIVFLRNYFCDNRQVLESSVNCWEHGPMREATDRCTGSDFSTFTTCNGFYKFRACIPDYIATRIPGCSDVQATFVRGFVDVIIDPPEEMCTFMESMHRNE